MPEILEIEMYRRGVEPCVGRSIGAVDAPDAWYLKDTDEAELRAELIGAEITATRRHGKLLVLESSCGPLGLRFGMTGRLVVDDVAVIGALEYSSKRLDPDWNRFALGFDAGGSLVMNDPRRLGGVLLHPEAVRLGPDAWSIDADGLRAAIGRRTSAIKALLLDQKRVAGLGNLLTDELLWRCGVHPARQCDDLTDVEVATLAETIAPMLDELYERGGSHLGDHVPARSAEAQCPLDGARMRHDTIGGRSTWWCDTHQH